MDVVNLHVIQETNVVVLMFLTVADRAEIVRIAAVAAVAAEAAEAEAAIAMEMLLVMILTATLAKAIPVFVPSVLHVKMLHQTVIVSAIPEIHVVLILVVVNVQEKTQVAVV